MDYKEVTMMQARGLFGGLRKLGNERMSDCRSEGSRKKYVKRMNDLAVSGKQAI